MAAELKTTNFDSAAVKASQTEVAQEQEKPSTEVRIEAFAICSKLAKRKRQPTTAAALIVQTCINTNSSQEKPCECFISIKSIYEMPQRLWIANESVSPSENNHEDSRLDTVPVFAAPFGSSIFRLTQLE
jgi:hypothetical protein